MHKAPGRGRPGAFAPSRASGLSSRGMSPTVAATLPEGQRALVERLQRWCETSVGRVAWYAIKVGLATGIYYGATRFGEQLAYLHGTVGAIWPPVGIGIALLVIGGPSLWPGVFLGGILPTDWSAPLGTILGQATGNTLEVLVAAVLFMRLTGRRTDFERVWDVLALVAAAALGTLISAVFGVVSLRLGDLIKASDVGSVFRTWWLGDFSGALVF